MPTVNSSRSSRAKFSFGFFASLSSMFRYIIMAASIVTASSSSRKLPNACLRSAMFWVYSGWATNIRLASVVKWPCQNRVITSRSGAGVRIM